MKYDLSVHRIVRQPKANHQYIERHSHPFFHFIYILNGKGKIIVNQEVIYGTKNDLILNAPGVEHEIFGVDNLSCLDIKFSCDEKLTAQLSRCNPLVHNVSIEQDRLIKAIFEEAMNEKDFYVDVINIKMLEVVFGILRNNNKKIIEENIRKNVAVNNFDQPVNHEIRKILHYIDNHISDCLRISDLAAMAGYNDSYFSTLFRRETGYSPNAYINQIKIEKAKEYIYYTNMNITEIAEKLGYESIHYFSKVFKKVVGMSPTYYVRKSQINMVINVVNDSRFTPKGEYEIPIKDVDDTNDCKIYE